MKRTLTLGLHRHVHTCGCGNELRCTTDDCAVGHDWMCPRCEQQIQDDYFSQLDTTQPEPHKEHTR